MSVRKGLIILALALLLPLAPAVADPQVGFSVGGGYSNYGGAMSLDFQSALSPYGNWMNVGNYGQCWQPYNAGANFMPFTNDGYWEYTEYGPTWASDQPWGWAAYHYGHWVFDPQYGWLWIPGYTWEAAPVQWAYGPGYIGWSPFMGAGFTNVNFWVFLNGNDWGDHPYQGRLILGNNASQFLNRADFHVQRAPIERTQLEQIVHRPIRTVPVQQQTVQINGRTTRVVVPQDRASTELSRIRQAARAGQARNNRPGMNRQMNPNENNENVEKPAAPNGTKPVMNRGTERQQKAEQPRNAKGKKARKEKRKHEGS